MRGFCVVLVGPLRRKTQKRSRVAVLLLPYLIFSRLQTFFTTFQLPSKHIITGHLPNKPYLSPYH